MVALPSSHFARLSLKTVKYRWEFERSVLEHWLKNPIEQFTHHGFPSFLSLRLLAKILSD